MVSEFVPVPCPLFRTDGGKQRRKIMTVTDTIPVPRAVLAFGSVPAGKYALRRLENFGGKTIEREWHFFEVQHVESGKWAGWTFLKEMHGSNKIRVPWKSDIYSGVLTAIARDPKHFSIQFGKQTGVCGVCGKQLTDPKSVRKGIGPVCAKGF